MADEHDLKAALDKAEEDAKKAANAQTWRVKDHSAGDELIGVLVEGEWRSTDHGRSRRLVIETPDGEQWVFWPSGTILEQEMQKLHPRIGSTIAFRYLGKQKPVKGQYEYNGWAVYCDGEPDPGHWRQSYQNMVEGEQQQQQPFGSDDLDVPY